MVRGKDNVLRLEGKVVDLVIGGIKSWRRRCVRGFLYPRNSPSFSIVALLRELRQMTDFDQDLLVFKVCTAGHVGQRA